MSISRIFIIAFVCGSLFYYPTITFANNEAQDEKVTEWFNEDKTTEENRSAEPPSETIGMQETNLVFPLIKMLFVLAFIIGLIYFLAKFVNKRTRSFHGNQSIQLVSGLSLGNQRSIQLVKIGDQILVLGVAETIQILKEISDKEEIEQLLAEQESSFTYDDLFTRIKNWFQARQRDQDLPTITTFDQQLKQMIAQRKSIYRSVEEKERNDE